MKIEICERPIFVLGPPRSGTSMMQWALRAHSQLWGGQESDYLIALVDRLREVWELGRRREKLHWLSGQNVDWDEFLRHIGVGVNTLYMSRSGGLRWVEQTPEYTMHLDDIVRLFPDAQFLFMVRDGREVVHSLRNFVNPVEHEEACRVWRRFMSAGLRFAESEKGGQMLHVSYRRAVDDTESELARVFAFIEEPLEAASVAFIRSKSPINSSFGGNITAGPRWASWTIDERRVFDRTAGDLLTTLGFEADASWITRVPVVRDGGQATGEPA